MVEPGKDLSVQGVMLIPLEPRRARTRAEHLSWASILALVLFRLVYLAVSRVFAWLAQLARSAPRKAQRS